MSSSSQSSQSSQTSVTSDNNYNSEIVSRTNYNTPKVIVNQGAPFPKNSHLIINPIIFGRDPITVRCPLCGNTVTTKTTDICNWKAICLFFATDIVFFPCAQACRRKDICCTDTVHICSSCNRKLGEYSAL